MRSILSYDKKGLRVWWGGIPQGEPTRPSTLSRNPLQHGLSQMRQEKSPQTQGPSQPSLSEVRADAPTYWGHTPAWFQRQRVWRHNGFTGSARMMLQQSRGMLMSDSLTPEAREIVSRIYADSYSLCQALKARVDPK